MCAPKDAKTCLRILRKYAESPLLIQDVYRNKPEKLIIPAELKMSYPTRAEIQRDGSIKFIEDAKGLHRWSHMRNVQL